MYKIINYPAELKPELTHRIESRIIQHQKPLTMQIGINFTGINRNF